jgi:hypothetical protein
MDEEDLENRPHVTDSVRAPLKKNLSSLCLANAKRRAGIRKESNALDRRLRDVFATTEQRTQTTP